MKQTKGFTLIELVIATGVFLVTTLGILALYNHAVLLSRYSESYTLALQSAQGKIEEMRTHPYNRLLVDYAIGGTPGNTFASTGLIGMGSVSFDTTNPAALGVRAIVSWQEKGRIFGEDRDLDGRLDAGEDLNANGLLDSPVTLVTYLTEEGP